MSDIDKRLSSLEHKEQRNSENIQECTKAVKDMAEAVNKFVVHAEISKVKEESQIKFNDEVKSDIKEIKSSIGNIEKERAKESQSRSFLMRYWPFLATAIGSVSLAKLLEMFPK